MRYDTPQFLLRSRVRWLKRSQDFRLGRGQTRKHIGKDQKKESLQFDLEICYWGGETQDTEKGPNSKNTRTEGQHKLKILFRSEN